MPRSSPKRSDTRQLASPSISVVMSCRTCRHKRWMRDMSCSADELRWGQMGSNARKTGCTLCACSLGEFRFSAGRWDRNRTCNLRFWSLLPFVQGRSGTYTKGLKTGHFDGSKYVEVHQRSPALGSILGSKRPSALISSEHRQEEVMHPFDT